jgi:methylated-DNA-[protein]-cysteine S-methyltransferase
MEQKNVGRRVLSERSSMDWDAVIDAPFGRLGIETCIVDGSLMVAQISYLVKDTPLQDHQTELGKEVENQCKSYFKDPSFQFDLPLQPRGTVFQASVWNEISKIKAGHTETYGFLAKKIRSAPRAVGQACGANPYPLVVPCHRVISAMGIGGFAHHAGEGFHRGVKAWLLEHEGANWELVESKISGV